MHKHFLAMLLKADFDSVDLGWGVGLCISNKTPVHCTLRRKGLWTRASSVCLEQGTINWAWGPLAPITLSPGQATGTVGWYNTEDQGIM